MDKMRPNRAIYLLPIGIATIMSYISSRYLFVGSALNLIPWGILAISWGLLAPNKTLALRLGALYGFSQSFIFLWIDKSGNISFRQFLILCGIIFLLGLFGAGCGWVWARLGWALRQKLKG